MGTVLLTYEFGAGLGHLSPLISVAKRLSPAHRLVFCLPEADAARSQIEQAFGARAELRAVERWRPVDNGAERAETLGDVFWSAGFGDADQVQAKARFWRETLSDIKPDLIIADFAPGVRLSAGGRPFVEVGYGFTVPPAGRALPPLRPWIHEVPAQSRAREFGLLASVNAARASVGGRAIDHFADLFRGDDTFLCTLPEFDMYAAYRTERHLAPIMAPMRMGPSVGRRTGPDVFLYLHANHPRLKELLAALTASGLRVAAYVSGAPVEAVVAQCGKNIGVLRRPANLAEMLPQAKLSIHHGGLGSSHAGLAAATPQLMFPRRLEWQINARAVEQLGGGRRHPAEPNGDVQGLAELITVLVNDATFQTAARHGSALLQEVLQRDAAAIIARTCEWRLGGG